MLISMIRVCEWLPEEQGLQIRPDNRNTEIE